VVNGFVATATGRDGQFDESPREDGFAHDTASANIAMNRP
jgi:hypothetical protein